MLDQGRERAVTSPAETRDWTLEVEESERHLSWLADVEVTLEGLLGQSREASVRSERFLAREGVRQAARGAVGRLRRGPADLVAEAVGRVLNRRQELGLEPLLALYWSEGGAVVDCALGCGAEVRPQRGPAVYLAGTDRLVCVDCAWELDASVVEQLESLVPARGPGCAEHADPPLGSHSCEQELRDRREASLTPSRSRPGKKLEGE